MVICDPVLLAASQDSLRQSRPPRFALLVLPALGLIVAYSVMWQHSGEEIITVTSFGLRITRTIYGPGQPGVEFGAILALAGQAAPLGAAGRGWPPAPGGPSCMPQES